MIGLIDTKEARVMNRRKFDIEINCLLFFLFYFLLCISLFEARIFSFLNEYSGYLVSGIAFIMVALKKEKVGGTHAVLFLLFYCAYCIVSIFFNGGGYGSILTISCGVLVYMGMRSLNYSKRYLSALAALNVGANIALFARSFGYFGMFLANRNRYVNPNAMAMSAVYTCLYGICLSNALRKKSQWGITLVLIISTAWSVWNFDSRGSLLAIGFFVIFKYLVPNKVWKKPRVFLFMVILVVISGTLFPFVYIYLYKGGINFSFMNKSLYTGREGIWINAFAAFSDGWQYWLFGIGSKAYLWDAAQNSHNSFFALIINFGLIGFALYYGFWIWQVRDLVHRAKGLTSFQYDLLLVFMSAFILGFVETNLVWITFAFFSYFSIALTSHFSECEEKALSRSSHLEER